MKCVQLAVGLLAFALLDASGNVVNIVEGGDPALWPSYTIREYSGIAVQIGDKWDGNAYARAPVAKQPEPNVAGTPLKILYDALVAKGVMPPSDIPAAYR